METQVETKNNQKSRLNGPRQHFLWDSNLKEL